MKKLALLFFAVNVNRLTSAKRLYPCSYKLQIVIHIRYQRVFKF